MLQIWNGPLGYFTYMFYLSKYYELIDTVILALRKKPTIPLHVYHHAIMLFGAWAWFAYPYLEVSTCLTPCFEKQYVHKSARDASCAPHLSAHPLIHPQ